MSVNATGVLFVSVDRSENRKALAAKVCRVVERTQCDVILVGRERVSVLDLEGVKPRGRVRFPRRDKGPEVPSLWCPEEDADVALWIANRMPARWAWVGPVYVGQSIPPHVPRLLNRRVITTEEFEEKVIALFGGAQ